MQIKHIIIFRFFVFDWVVTEVMIFGHICDVCKNTLRTILAARLNVWCEHNRG